MSLKNLFTYCFAAGALAFSASSFAYNCTGVPQFQAGNVATGAIVQNAGKAYQCTVGGWCSQGGAYTPGSGWAWTYAWTDLGSCSGGGGGGTTSSSSSSTSSSGGGGGGSCPAWNSNNYYYPGDVVSYNGRNYVAEHENPGYDPTISTWFWEPTSSGCGGSGSSSSSSSSSSGGGGGSCPAWSSNGYYYPGDIVTFNGSNYVAEHENPGYDPTISTWFWEPTSSGCGGTGSSSSSSSSGSSSGGTSFTEILTEQRFEQMFPSRNSFYTYQGLVNATRSYPGFGGTGDATTRAREIAAAMANFSHETGGLWYITEIAQGEYCSGGATPCGVCAPGKRYFGRGPIQLSWNYNYCAAGQALGLNLWANPDQVAQDPTIAWQTALWFWMTQSGAGDRSAHSCMTGGAGFGCTIRTINGSLECNGGRPDQVQSRVNIYRNFTSILGVSMGGNTGC